MNIRLHALDDMMCWNFENQPSEQFWKQSKRTSNRNYLQQRNGRLLFTQRHQLFWLVVVSLVLCQCVFKTWISKYYSCFSRVWTVRWLTALLITGTVA